MVKRILKVVAGIVAVLVLAVAGTLLYINWSGIPTYPPGKVDLKVEVTPERVAGGRRTVQLLCASCHLDNDTGTLAGKPMPDVPAQFGSAHSANITQDEETGIGSWTDGEIAYLLRTGVRRDGRYTPPWMVKLAKISDEDLKDIIAFLRSDDPLVRPVKAKRPLSKHSLLTKVLSRVVFKPLPYPTAPIPAPDMTDKVAYGKYLVQARALCFPCHSADFAKIDDFTPERSAGYLGGGNAMPDMNLVNVVVVGALAGWVASVVVNRRHGVLLNVIVGLTGSVIGGWLAWALHFPIVGSGSGISASAGGAIILLLPLSVLPHRLPDRRRPRPT